MPQDDEAIESVDAREVLRHTQELTRALKKALKRREKDLVSFDKKLASLRGSTTEATKSTLARLEKRRGALGEEHDALKGILDEAEALMERQAGLRSSVEFEEKRRKRAEGRLRTLEHTVEQVTAEAAQLREEIEEKSHVIHELQQIVNVLTSEGDEEEEAPPPPASEQQSKPTGVYLHVYKRSSREELPEAIDEIPLPAPAHAHVVDDADMEPLDDEEADDDFDVDMEAELADDDPEIVEEGAA